LETVRAEITRLDPIHIGTSGQVKEFRSEEEYGEIGDPHHRHVSHLCPLYPGTLINSKKPDWIKGVITALDFRGNNTTGWAMAHRMNLRVRTKEAEKARAVYSKFLKERTLPNLWTVHPPFQIDGNLGTMAGVAEMLLQSNEGYIEPLAALPKAWSNGEFRGLVARGDFEVDCKWKKGKVYSLNITARSGGKCTLKYNNIAESRIINSEGSVLPFQIVEEDVIEFKTQKDGEYNFTIK